MLDGPYPQARLATRATGAAQRARIHYDFVGLEHDALVAAYEAVDAAIERVARAKRVLLIDAHAALGGVEAHFLDHVHLTVAGSDALASLMAERMKGVLERPAPRQQLANAEPGR